MGKQSKRSREQEPTLIAVPTNVQVQGPPGLGASTPTPSTSTPDNRPNDPPKSSLKKGKKNPLNPLAKKYGHHKHPHPARGSSAAIKKRIRDTTRLLARPGLSATVKRDLQRRLGALQEEVQEVQAQGVEKRMREKYKYIRFVERKKVDKRIRRLEREVATCTDVDKRGPLDTALAEARLLQAYIDYFPSDMKYISLFPASARSGEEDEEASGSEDEGKDEGARRQEHAPPPSNASQALQQAILDRLREAMAIGPLRNLKLHKADFIRRAGTPPSSVAMGHGASTTKAVSGAEATPAGKALEQDDFFL